MFSDLLIVILVIIKKTTKPLCAYDVIKQKNANDLLDFKTFGYSKLLQNNQIQPKLSIPKLDIILLLTPHHDVAHPVLPVLWATDVTGS